MKFVKKRIYSRKNWPSWTWDNEPDLVAYKRNDLQIIIIRRPRGHLDSYIELPENHAAFTTARINMDIDWPWDVPSHTKSRVHTLPAHVRKYLPKSIKKGSYLYLDYSDYGLDLSCEHPWVDPDEMQYNNLKDVKEYSNKVASFLKKTAGNTGINRKDVDKEIKTLEARVLRLKKEKEKRGLA